MENLFTQKLSYTKINTYKNYSKVIPGENNAHLINESNESDERLFEKERHLTYRLPRNIKKNIFFFKSKENDEVKIRLYPLNKNTHYTKKDRQIKRHFGNPFSSISLSNSIRTINKNGDKINIRLYTSKKTRGLNCVFFKNIKKTTSLTFNLKTGDFIIVDNKSVLKNSFFALNNILKYSELFNLKGTISSIDLDAIKQIDDNAIKQIDDGLFLREFCKLIEFDYTWDVVSVENLMSFFVKKFVTTKKIKTPDNYSLNHIINFYPTEKFLKKNDRKLLASILDMFGIKSKYTIKILHKYPDIIHNMSNFIYLIKFFGDDYQKYLSRIENFPIFLLDSKIRISECENNKSRIFNSLELKNLIDFEIRDIEKENLIKIINSAINKKNNISNNLYLNMFIDLNDHLKMIKIIRKYDSTIELRAKNMSEFLLEHNHLSSLISKIKRGFVIEYVYHDKTIQEIEAPCEKIPQTESEIGSPFAQEFLYPKILKREEEYYEEGIFMRHCVSSYLSNVNSIIISVRTSNGMDRVTCEYDISTGRVKQERHFCNKQPPKEFEFALEELKFRVNKLARFGILNWKERKKTPLKINDNEIIIQEKDEQFF